MISPAVQSILDQNHFELVRILRYGPRFICLKVRSGDRVGMFKMALPVAERSPQLAPPGYTWTEHEEILILEQRLLKEALFLQFFSQQLGGAGFEPQVIALSDTSPVWSLRTYIAEQPLTVDNSDFRFDQRFFELVTPRQAVDFFRKLHELSDRLPQSLTDLIMPYTSALTNPMRFERSLSRAEAMPQFKSQAAHLGRRFQELVPEYDNYRRVITQYEPYSCHLFVVNGKIGLIDWENVGWGHALQDLSVLWMRCFEQPDWQADYLEVLREYGYFGGNGQLFWDSELLIQSFANHQYFKTTDHIGTPEYDAAALTFFEHTIERILGHSPYFKA